MSDLFPDAPRPDQAPYPWQARNWETLLANLDDGQLAHAYLVSGASGLGKRAFVHAFARYLLCLEPVAQRACGHCPNCLVAGGSYHPDILVVAPQDDSRDIKVDQVRELGEFLQQTSHSGRAKIVILQQAQALNISAANALLKSLEEPSANSYLFLVTDMPGMLLPTIRSRCQRIAMHSPSWKQGEAWLQQVQPQLLEHHGVDEVLQLWQELGGRPLRLLDLLEQDYLEQRHDFELAMWQFEQGRLSLADLVVRVAKQGEGTVLGYLQRLSTILIKYLATDELPSGISDEVMQLSQRTATTDKRGALMPLLRFNQQAGLALRQLAASTNPNPRLLLESLLHQWSLLRGIGPG